jgi:hypothetical protein
VWSDASRRAPGRQARRIFTEAIRHRGIETTERVNAVFFGTCQSSRAVKRRRPRRARTSGPSPGLVSSAW